jgi:hypothetical protein
VFGYGSLLSRRGWRVAPRPACEKSKISRRPTREPRAAGFVTELAGFRRGWGVAMDNRRDLPGYKYYTAADGSRPDVFVAFLDIWPSDDRAAAVNGVCLPVDDAALEALDRRERNYERIDVSERVAAAGVGEAGEVRIWTYIGSAAGRDRLRRSRAAGAAVIDANYVADVEAAFASLGEAEHRAGAGSLDPGDLPVVPLRRHDLG